MLKSVIINARKLASHRKPGHSVGIGFIKAHWLPDQALAMGFPCVLDDAGSTGESLVNWMSLRAAH